MVQKLTRAQVHAEYNPAQEVTHLRDELAALERQLKAQRNATGEARLKAMELTNAIAAAVPPKMLYKASNTSETPVTYVLHLTDLHEGEVTEKDEVEGFGEFNPDIFTARLMELGQRVIDHVSIMRHGYNIPRLHILGTGDYISGDIHEELRVTNAYPTAVQSVNCGMKLGALIAMLAPHFEQVTSDWITLDNHGRMTKKNQASQGGENNWGYVVAHIVKQYASRLSNVDVRIHAKPSTIVRVGDHERYLCFHGHQIKGWAGLPFYGFERRVAMEAVKRMGSPEDAFTKLVFGHFHVAVDTLNYNAGGSLSGTNTFDHSCGRHARAHQTSWLVHEKHGQFAFSRWWL